MEKTISGHLAIPCGEWSARQRADVVIGRDDGNKARSPYADKIWVGGDCAHGGEDLTVTAVEDGKIAAESIHKTLAG